MSKRKFTLYQASRFTKISRYKLEQAIEDGILVSAEGKGNVKCFILEEDLNKFIEDYGEQYRRFTYPEDYKSTVIADELSYISKDIHDQLVQEKDRVIGLLEFQNKQLIPISNQNEIMEKTIIINELKQIAEKAISEISPAKLTIKENLSSRLSELEANIKIASN